MVHQHFMLVENFSVIENIILGFEGEFVFGEKFSQAKINLEKLCEDYNLKIVLDAIIADLSVGFRQRVEILKSLYRGAEVFILDDTLKRNIVHALFRYIHLDRYRYSDIFALKKATYLNRYT